MNTILRKHFKAMIYLREIQVFSDHFLHSFRAAFNSDVHMPPSRLSHGTNHLLVKRIRTGGTGKAYIHTGHTQLFTQVQYTLFIGGKQIMHKGEGLESIDIVQFPYFR